MNKRQREIIQASLDSEKAIIKDLEKIYKQALNDINQKIADLLARKDADMQWVIYQVQYQEALKTQVSAILDTLNNNEFETISQYLTTSYEDGFIGVLYDLQGQNIPLIFPINQKRVVQAIKNDSKLSTSLYKKLKIDVNELKKKVQAEISRGIANNHSYDEMARNINNRTNVGLNKALRIARTESHRVGQQATYDAQTTAKEKGADVVKQWDSMLDRKTRPHHAQLDGQIRELDESFEIAGRKAMYPGDFGVAAEDVNCRCVMLQRAKWALDDEELQTLKERASYYGLDKTNSFNEFKKKYIKEVTKT